MVDAINARGLSVTLEQRRALANVDFNAQYGAVTAIVGPNGAGKSTLLRAIAGLLPYQGSIQLGGQDGAALSPRERAGLLAFVPQQTQLRVAMPVRDVIALGRYAHGRGSGRLNTDDLAAVDRAIGALDLNALSDRLFTELSGGEQRRVIAARALATGARVLLFDEPTASLDVRHALLLYRLARAQAEEGVAVVMVLHQLADAQRFADQVVLLAAGAVIAAGVPSEVITAAHVKTVYGVELRANATLGFDLL